MLVKQILFTRHSGAVKRCHTLLTTSENRVDAHSWGVAVLAHLLWPNASKELILACLFHDAAETLVGDVPHPTKKLIPLVGDNFDKVEEEALHEIGFDFPLSVEDYVRLKFCDMFDFLLYMLVERAQGNALVHDLCRRAFTLLRGLFDKLSSEDQDRLGHVMLSAAGWANLPENFSVSLTEAKEDII